MSQKMTNIEIPAEDLHEAEVDEKPGTIYWMKSSEGKRIKMEQFSEDESIDTEKPSFPSHIPEILEVVLKNFSNRELWEFRKISKCWNNEVCRLLMLSQTKIHKTNGDLKKKYKELFNLVQDSSNPGILMKEIQISAKTNCHIEIPSKENPFRNFGDHVKRLKIKEDPNLTFLNTFLARENAYCPNVEILDYNASCCQIPLHLLPPVFKSSLKLKELRFRAWTKIKGTKQTLLLGSILKNSPYLTRIHIDCDNPKAMQGFLTLFQNLPLLTQNLTKLYIDTRDFSHLKELAKCKFSEKLKILKLHYYFNDSDNLPNTKHASESDLMNFLNRVATSLEEFEIEVTFVNYESDTEDEDENDIIVDNFDSHSYPHTIKDLPAMPNLKILSLPQCNVRSVDALHYLKKVPSLKSLLLLNSLDTEEMCFADLVESFFRSNFAHKNLERIQFLEDNTFMEICKPSLIPVLNETFPNLSHVWISTMEYSYFEEPIEVPFEFQKSFEALSHMNNLKLLEIDLGGIGHRKMKEKQDLTLAFRCLKTAPKLETLVFYHKNGPLYDFPKEEWLIELLDSLKLQTVHFYGFAMENETEYESAVNRIIWDEVEQQLRWPKIVQDRDWVKDRAQAEIVQAFTNRKIELMIKRGRRMNEIYKWINNLND